MDRFVGFRPFNEGNGSIFFVMSHHPKTGTQTQTAKAECDIVMIMF